MRQLLVGRRLFPDIFYVTRPQAAHFLKACRYAVAGRFRSDEIFAHAQPAVAVHPVT